MRLGVLLPTFRSSPRDAIAAADQAAAVGLDGVFAYDHLWPMGSPARPAIAPFEVLAVVAERQPSLVVGPLVARIGLVDDSVLLGQCRALRIVADGRVIVGLGTGDHLSREENLAYGLRYLEPDVRRASLRDTAKALHDEGMEVWVGGGAPATRVIATAIGCTLNLWDVEVAEVLDASASGPVSWAGPAPSGAGPIDEGALAGRLAALAGAGATWAVFTPQVPIELLGRLRDGVVGDEG